MFSRRGSRGNRRGIGSRQGAGATVVVEGVQVENSDLAISLENTAPAVTSVEFFDGVSSLGTDASGPPFTASLVGVTPGSHTIRAVPNVGNEVSTIIVIQPDTPTLVAPTDESAATVGVAVTLTASAPVDANTTKYEWYKRPDGGGAETLLDTDLTATTGGSGSWTPDTAEAVEVLVRRTAGGLTADSAVADVVVSAVSVRHFRRPLFFASDAAVAIPADIQSPTGVSGKVNAGATGAGGPAVANTGSGGGGAHASGEISVTPGGTIAYVHGATGTDPTDGGDSTWGTTLIVAKGGLSRTNGGTGGAAASCTGTVKTSGGNGTAGTGNQSGGASGGTTGSGSAATAGAPDGCFGSITPWFSVGGGSQTGSVATGIAMPGFLEYSVPATAGYPRLMSKPTWGRDTANATTRNITLPSGSGGTLIVIVISDNSATVSAIGMGGDWTAHAQQDQATPLVSSRSFYQNATGSETVAVTSSVTEQVMWAAFRVEDSAGGTPTTVDTTTTQGNSTNADPPSHSPAGGSAKYLLFAYAGLDASATGTNALTALPANYTDGIIVPPATTTGVLGVVAWRLAETAAENPAAFTTATEQWVTGVIAVSPT